MKTRIALTGLLLLIAGWFTVSFGQPVSTLARNKAVVATVNGGDQAYVTQNVADTTVMWPWTAAATLIGLGLIWQAPIRKVLVRPSAINI